MSPADVELLRQLVPLVGTLGPLGPALVVVAVLVWAELRLLPRLPLREDVRRDKALGRAIADKLGVSEADLRAAVRAEDDGLPLGIATAATILPAGPSPVSVPRQG